jgi:hypothetical protein
MSTRLVLFSISLRSPFHSERQLPLQKESLKSLQSSPMAASLNLRFLVEEEVWDILRRLVLREELKW